mgnify:CR=1 FL=1
MIISFTSGYIPKYINTNLKNNNSSNKYKKVTSNIPMYNSFGEALNILGYKTVNLKDGSKVINKYDSRWVKVKLKQHNLGFKESDILANVSKVAENCDLTGTTIEDLPQIKTIGKNLTLDASSSLKNLKIS